MTSTLRTAVRPWSRQLHRNNDANTTGDTWSSARRVNRVFAKQYTMLSTAVRHHATAASSVVVALCAVVLTPHLTIDGGLQVEQLRTSNREALSTTVFDAVTDRYPNTVNGSSPHSCPADVAIKKGVVFTCTFTDNQLTGDNKEVKAFAQAEDSHSGAVSVETPTH
ncbi:hypothetical protein [Saccharothrix longispora]|uniref:hypothetical protein n=1 Tax=Saccharothrix longispora TaxID=33920 RepID=UPI0028FD85AD|nr:hypothetical protein [Saccharothrix longispora]MDU0294233.1 hypothetical protein [Saccharothrix longispora]